MAACVEQKNEKCGNISMARSMYRGGGRGGNGAGVSSINGSGDVTSWRAWRQRQAGMKRRWRMKASATLIAAYQCSVIWRSGMYEINEASGGGESGVA